MFVENLCIIYIDALRREYAASWLLGEAVKLNSSIRVIYASRSSLTYLLRILSPEFLVTSHPFAVEQHVVERVVRNGTKIVCCQVEGIVRVEHDIDTTYPSTIDYSLFHKIFVWNAWERDWLIKNRNISQDNIDVSGCIRNDLIKNVNAAPNAKRIGIIGRFEMINTFDGRHPFQNFLSMEGRHIDRWKTDLEALYVSMRLTKELIDRGFSVSLRPHPNENLQSYKFFKDKLGPNFSVDAGHDLYEWLETVDVVAGTVSTAFLEPYLIGRPIVCLDSLFAFAGNDLYKEWRDNFHAMSYMPKTYDELSELFSTPELPAKKSDVVEKYILDFYSLKDYSDSNGVGIVSRSIVNAALGPRATGVQTWLKLNFSVLIKYVIDLLGLFRACVQNRGAWTIRNMRQYNYNEFLHPPTGFMKKCKQKYLEIR